MKKAQGLPMNVIIIAVLVLLVLVILALIFSSRMKGWSTSTKSCASKGGFCKTGNNGQCDPILGEAKLGDSSTTDCTADCCIGIQ